MADRTAYLYLRVAQEKFDLAVVIDHLQRYGMNLEYPGTTVVKVLSDQGDQLEQDKDWLISRIRRVRTISFQWWRNDSEDVYCRIRFFSGTSTIEFGLDGMSGDEELLFLDTLLGLAKLYVANGFLVGCVVDHSGLAVTHFDHLFLDKPCDE